MRKPYAEMTPEQLALAKARRRRAYTKEWQGRNREKYLAYMKAYQQSPKGRATRDIWRKAHREEINRKQRARRQHIAKKFNVSTGQADKTFTVFHRHLRDVLGDKAIEG